MSTLTFEAARTALLVMDFQTPIVERVTAGKEALLAAAAAAIAAARDAGVRVIHVVVGFRPGFPEVSPRNQGFSAVKAMGGVATDIDPRVAPASDGVVVTKHRVSAFMGTDLEMVLRANDIDTLAMCGIATSGVVLSTLRHAADGDYRIVVLEDGCVDMDAEVHACLMRKVFPRQATVTTSAEFVRALAASPA
jgi:nicotinamidase-related amidase